MVYWNFINAEYYFPFDVGACLQTLIKHLSLILAFYQRSNSIGFVFFCLPVSRKHYTTFCHLRVHMMS